MALQVRRLADTHILVEGAGVADHGDVAESGSIAWAENELGGAGVVELLPGTYDFDTSITIAATTELIVRRGAIITDGASNPNFTVSGTLRTGPYAIFNWTGTGTVTIHGLAVYDPSNWVALDSQVADLRRKNAIINGDFNIWQRGTSFAAAASGTYYADRFGYTKTGVMVHTISRDTDVPTQTESGHGSNYSVKVDCTTIDAAIAAADLCKLNHFIEGYDFAPFVGNTATLSFWVKATKTGTYCIGFGCNGIDRSYVAEYTVNAASTWEKKTITLTFDYVGGTWNYINGIGLRIYWTLAAGTNFQAAVCSWQNGDYFATANQVNACDNVANNFWLSQVQLELGDVATPFEFNLIEQELALCQRYYSKSYNQGVAPGTNDDNGMWRWICDLLANTDSVTGIDIIYPVVMRTAPTVTTWDIADASGKISVGGANGRNPSFLYSSEVKTNVYGTAGGAVTTKSITFHWTADAEL